MIAAVNHSGDSDSTGSITGAILGTMLSVDAIPKSWIDQLENKKEIRGLSQDMHRIFKEAAADIF